MKSEQSQRVESSKTSVSSKSVDPLPLTPDRMRQEIEELRRDLEERRQTVRGMETALASANQNYQSFLQLNEEVNQIAKFLRIEYAREIETGQHGGLSLSQAVIRYLSRERRIGRWRRRIAEWMRPLKPC